MIEARLSGDWGTVKRYWAIICLGCCVAIGASAQTAATAPQHPADAHSGHFASPQNFHEEEKLPDAPSQRPLTDHEKFEIFVRDSESPLTFISAGVTAGYNTLTGRVYGTEWGGFGKNYAAAVAEHETSSFLGNYLFPKLLNQDPRFHPSEKDGFWPRSTYAASRVLITKNDFGKTTVNSSYLLGVLVSTAIGNLYRPARYRSVGQTFLDFGSGVGGDAGMNVLKEFWPEVSKRIKPLTPKRFRKLEDQLVGYPQPEPQATAENR